MGCNTRDLTLAASKASAAVLICTAPVLGQVASSDDVIAKNPNISDDSKSIKSLMTAEEFMKAEIDRLIELKQQAKAQQPRRGQNNNNSQNAARGGGPANDTCAGAEVIALVTGGVNSSTSVAGSTLGATNNYNDAASCGFGIDGAPDVVFVWTADADGRIDVSTCSDADFDTKLYVWEDECPGTPGSIIGCNDDGAGCTGFTSRATNIEVFSGSQYFIVVDGWTSAESGNFNLTLDYKEPTTVPDTCEEAEDIFVAGGVGPGEFPTTITGDTAVANDDYNAVCPYTTTGGRDVVYSFTPTEDGFISVDLCGGATNYDSKIYIYENTCGGSTIACSDDACTSSIGTLFVSRLTNVEVEAGNTYFIVVDGWAATSAGTYVMTIDDDAPPPPPPSCERDAGGAAAPYSEPALETGGVFSLSDSELGFLQVARFDTGGGLQVEKIRFWGTEVEFNPLTGTLSAAALCGPAAPPEEGPARVFTVTVYDDLFGAPGAERCSYELAATDTIDTGIRPLSTLPDLPLIQYDIELPTDCITAGGWLSIDGGTEIVGSDPVCAFLWHSAGNAVGVGSVTISGGAITESATKRALCALGTRLGIGEFTGACCSEEFQGPFGTDCLVGNGGDCVNQFAGEFFPFLECEDIECFIPQGACCTGDTGEAATEYLCLGVMSSADCDAAAGALVPPVASPSWLSETSCFECPFPPPAGDNCSNPVDVSAEGAFVLTTVGATLEGGESDSVSCTSGTGNNSIWASFDVPAGPAGILNVNTCGSALDTIVTIWDECDGTELACNDDFCAFQSQVVVAPAPGSTVLIRITGWNSANGPFVLNVDYAVESACCLPAGGCSLLEEDDCTLAGGIFKPGVTDCAAASCNDSCATAEELAADLTVGLTLNPVTTNASADGFNTDSTCWGSSGGNQASWYTFVAPCDGSFDAVTTTSNDTEMLLFDLTALGDCPTAGAVQQIAEGCDESCVAGGFSACIEGASIVAGNTYALRIAAFGAGTLNGSAAIDLLIYDCAMGGGPGDVNNDGCVDIDDLLDVIGGYGSTYFLADLIDVISNWNAGCP